MIRSLQGKLGTGLLLSLITAFIALWGFVSISIRYLTEDYIYTRLAHDAETLLAAIVKGSPEFEVESSRLGAVYQQPFSGHYFEIIYDGQVIRSRSLWDQSLDVTIDQTDQAYQETRLYQTGPQQQPLLVLVSHFVKQQQPITIIIAEDFSPVEVAIGVFQVRLSIIIAVILLVLIVIQAWVMRRGLKPITQLQDDLKALENGHIHRLETSVPRELTPLVTEINHLHTRLDARLKRHRNALSDLAHALKKPLTVIRQLSKDPNLETLPEIKQTLERQAETTRQLTQRILSRARLAGAVKTDNLFDFDHDFPGLLDTLRMMYRDKSVTISTNITNGSQCPFDREDMLELLGNLLDNACKWANQTVYVEVSQTSALKITIQDDGPGAPKESLDSINQRGVRLDETVEGHGLGLSIVSDIVTHYNGTMTSGVSTTFGGFKIDVELPL
ncbi:ATP-binding protein [Alkalimarinus coralli]|uniref:ATP-binding protein n=1 Tax=Alkalimarinus coralli TaxID=2935863 RepID=UPI00202B5F9E|nr:ATP-binding protein [Alkalimarinus coralli]